MQTIRIILFLFGCILSRLILVILAKYLNKEYVKIMGYLAIPLGLSFMYLYFIGNRKADSQLEWLGDKKIWWNNIRPIHGALYLLFAWAAITENKYAWVFLLIDVIVGLVSWLFHHKII